jgi:hypothetical protein
MKQRRSIEILIHPSGSIQIDAIGFSGSDCEQSTAFLEQALGTITTKQRKPEYHQRAKRAHHQKVGL